MISREDAVALSMTDAQRVFVLLLLELRRAGGRMTMPCVKEYFARIYHEGGWGAMSVETFVTQGLSSVYRLVGSRLQRFSGRTTSPLFRSTFSNVHVLSMAKQLRCRYLQFWRIQEKKSQN